MHFCLLCSAFVRMHTSGGSTFVPFVLCNTLFSSLVVLLNILTVFSDDSEAV